MLHRFEVARPILVLALAVLSVPAFAHSRPKVMEPAANSSVVAPSVLSVVFTESLEPKFSSLELTDEKGTVISTSKSIVDPTDQKHITLALPKLAPGVYYVHWVSAASDGHRMDGDYSFRVK